MYIFGKRYRDAGHDTHAWLEMNELIIDITGDQFDREPVVVTTDRSWHDTWLDQETEPPPATNSLWWAQHAWPVFKAGTGQ